MARRLKVFQTRLGFYDTVVAAPSQAAALRAWGLKQNLFETGEARLTEDEAAAAAVEHPGIPLRRAVGSDDPYAVDPQGLPSLPAAPQRPRAKPGAKPGAKTRAAKRPQPPVDRSRLDAAEAALEALNEARKQEEAAFRREAEALEARRSAAQAAYVAAHKAAAARVAKARAAYRKAGGTERV
ncbi:MAG: hypothetical protein A2882_05700 [Phenylobacterium sp. RIFCSPHIGHO2_01_FULL_70_10]|nr:MAG: hypothetical protein A2882_05700 [Phenylobacterium sp. RIFCSPHIGHO2_01_FULL_70_10]